jgi:hypothetical protein
MAVIEKKAAQSPASLLPWEKAVLEDRHRRMTRRRRLSKNAVALDESDLD